MITSSTIMIMYRNTDDCVLQQGCLFQCIKATCPSCRQFFSARNIKRITPVSNTITQDAPHNDSALLKKDTLPLGKTEPEQQEQQPSEPQQHSAQLEQHQLELQQHIWERVSGDGNEVVVDWRCGTCKHRNINISLKRCANPRRVCKGCPAAKKKPVKVPSRVFEQHQPELMRHQPVVQQQKPEPMQQKPELMQPIEPDRMLFAGDNKVASADHKAKKVKQYASECKQTDQCQRNPHCTRGFNHHGIGGHYASKQAECAAEQLRKQLQCQQKDQCHKNSGFTRSGHCKAHTQRGDPEPGMDAANSL